MKAGTLWVTGDAAADALVNTNPTALMIAMLLDQQVSIEWAFAGPERLRGRLAAHSADLAVFDAGTLAELEPEILVAVACEKPAIHRYPAVMARRIREMCAHVVDHYDGRPERIWQRRRHADTIVENLLAVPGYGDEKARIFTAVLAKRFGIRPEGWQLACSPFGDDQPRSVADMGSEADRLAVREWRKARKAEGKSKFD